MVPLEHIRRINEDLLKVFVQNKDIIDKKTMRMQMTSEGLLIDFNNLSKRLFQMEIGVDRVRPVAVWHRGLTLSKNQNSSTLLELEGHTGRFEAKTTNADDDKWSISTQRALSVPAHEKEGVKEEQFNKMVATRHAALTSFADLDHPYHNRVSIMVRGHGTMNMGDFIPWARMKLTTSLCACRARRYGRRTAMETAIVTPAEANDLSGKTDPFCEHLSGANLDTAASAIEASVAAAPARGLAGNQADSRAQRRGSCRNGCRPRRATDH